MSLRPVPRPSVGLFVVGVSLACALLTGACGPGGTDLALLDCVPLVAPPDAPDPVTPSDTLRVIVALERRSAPLEVLARVDRLDAEGLVIFPPTAPTTAAGAGATVTAPARYKVCVESAPRGVVFQGGGTPRDKVWLRVSSDRPVEIAVRIGGDDGVTLTPVMNVAPGGSARRRWAMPAGAR